MSLYATCPHCTAPVRALDSAAGKAVRCPECLKAFYLAKPHELEEVAAKAAPAPKKSSVVRGQAAKRTKAPAPPADDDNDPDPPYRQKSENRVKEPLKGATLSLAVLLFLGIGSYVALVILLLADCGLVWWATRDTTPEPQANSLNTTEDSKQDDPKPVERWPDPNLDPNPNPKPEPQARRAPAGWQMYTDKEATFSVFFPEGKVEERSNKNPQTGVLSNVYVLQDQKMGMEYTVLVVDPGVQGPVRGALLEAFKAEAARGQTLLSEQRLKLGDYPGVEQQLMGGGKLTVGRAFEVSGKIFAVAVSVAGQERPESRQNIKTCLDSFKIADAGVVLITVDPTPPPNLGGGKPPPGWQVVVAPDASFSVLLPEGPITTAPQTDQQSGATITIIAVNDPRRMLTGKVVITAGARLPPAALLMAFKKWFAGGLPIKGEQKIMMGDIPGVAFQYFHQGWVETVHAYVLPDRVIAVVVKAPADKGPQTAQNTSTCLDSFKIPAAGLNMPGKPPGAGP